MEESRKIIISTLHTTISHICHLRVETENFPQVPTLAAFPSSFADCAYTVLSHYYDTRGISKLYRYIRTMVVNVEVPKQCLEAGIFARHCSNQIYRSI
jgi:hypothetical protein